MAKKIGDLPKGVQRERIGEGAYPSRVVQVIRLGTQEDEWKGVTKHVPKVLVAFEIPEKTIEIDGEEKPRWLSIQMTESNGEKAKFRKLCTAAALHKTIDYEHDLLGAPVTITVGTTSGGKDKITDIASVPKSFVKAVPELANDPVFFDIDEPDMDVFNTFPDFIKEMIVAAPEWNGGDVDTTSDSASSDDSDDDENPFE